MRIIRYFGVLLCISFLFVGCKPGQNPGYSAESVSQYSTSSSFVFGKDVILTVGTPSVGGSGFYMVSPYTDMALPLCFDPVCSHTGNDCPALALSGSTLFNYTCDSAYMYYAYNPQRESDMDLTKIIRTDLSTAARKELLTLSNRIFGLKYDSGFLYYIENNADKHNRLCRLNLQTSEMTVLLDGENTHDFYDMFCIKDNKIYYLCSEHDGLYEYDIGTGGTRCLVSTYISDLFISGERILLSCQTTDRHFTEIYEIQTGSAEELTVDGGDVYGVIDLAGDTLYYTMSEQIHYSMQQDAQLIEMLGDEALRMISDRHYSNTAVWSYDLTSHAKKQIGTYNKHTIHTIQVCGNKLYIKGTRAIDMGNDYIATEDFSGLIDLSDPELRYIRY